ncbi:MAG TPA: DUF4147 domain-containing protein [Thermomicrobiales bacterium]|nr:DUF4147 domain-containing protein [Thermomicrobiales bacterium]
MDLDSAMRTVRDLFDAAVAAVDVRAAVRRTLAVADGGLTVGGEDVPLAPGGRLFVVAFGKAAAAMAAEAEAILGDRIAAGVAITKYGNAEPTRTVEVREAGHPTPDEAGRRAAQEVSDLLAGTTPDDVVLCLISGGGSALLTAPAEGIGLDDLRATTDALLAAGATINELNAVRKHLETLKGGGLAAAAAPARVVALAVSDVLGDPLDVIASGPTVGDTSTYDDAWGVIERYHLAEKVPASVAARLRAGRRDEAPETPRPDDPLFRRVRTLVVANLRMAAEGAARRARDLGYDVAFLDLAIEGEAREVGQRLAARAREARDEAGGGRRCLIGGGETTVTVRGDGLGGRNTEVALAAALALDGVDGVALASLASDGDDGSTKSAGAVATGETVARGRARGLDAADSLARNDSARYFERAGGLLVTGPTQTNVADLYVILLD